MRAQRRKRSWPPRRRRRRRRRSTRSMPRQQRRSPTTRTSSHAPISGRQGWPASAHVSACLVRMNPIFCLVVVRNSIRSMAVSQTLLRNAAASADALVGTTICIDSSSSNESIGFVSSNHHFVRRDDGARYGRFECVCACRSVRMWVDCLMACCRVVSSANE